MWCICATYVTPQGKLCLLLRCFKVAKKMTSMQAHKVVQCKIMQSEIRYVLQFIQLYSHSVSSWVIISSIILSLACSQPLCCSPYLFSTSLSNPLTCHLKQNQHVLGAGLWKGNCQSIRIQIINIFYTINPIFCLVAYLSASPPHLSFLSWLLFITLRRVSSCQTLLSSPPHHCHCSLHHSLPLSFLPSLSPPACLPSSFHLSSLSSWQYLREEATCGPSGESADSCVHTLSGGPQLFTHFSLLLFPLSIFTLPFSSLPAFSVFTSLLLLHTEIACLPLSIAGNP